MLSFGAVQWKFGGSQTAVCTGARKLCPSLPVNKPPHTYKMLTWRKLESWGKITASNERFLLAGCQFLALFAISLCTFGSFSNFWPLKEKNKQMCFVLWFLFTPTTIAFIQSAHFQKLIPKFWPPAANIPTALSPHEPDSTEAVLGTAVWFICRIWNWWLTDYVKAPTW